MPRDMRRPDGYLSRKARDLHPQAMVYCEPGTLGHAEQWTLYRGEDPPLDLGHSFRSAHHALLELLRAKRAKQREDYLAAGGRED
jgi:hypothetical protein